MISITPLHKELGVHFYDMVMVSTYLYTAEQKSHLWKELKKK